MAKKFCNICDKKIGFLTGSVTLKDAYICMGCLTSRGFPVAEFDLSGEVLNSFTKFTFLDFQKAYDGGDDRWNEFVNLVLESKQKKAEQKAEQKSQMLDEATELRDKNRESLPHVQKLMERFRRESVDIESLDKKDLVILRKIAQDLAGNDNFKSMVDLSFMSNTVHPEEPCKVAFLSVLVEQNWMIIRQLSRLNKNIETLMQGHLSAQSDEQA